MVVAGMPYCPRRDDQTRNLGPWSVFHDLIYAADQKTFPLLLVPAHSALPALSALSAPTPAKPAGASMLLFGSEGDEVKALQKRLAARGFYRGPISGRLDARTYRAWKQPVVKPR
jgi:hypothetical protein